MTGTFLVLFALTLSACDVGGSGGGGAPAAAVAAPPVAATQAVDLPVGQTVAVVSWAPSQGDVVGYLVYESRNDGDYQYVSNVASTSTSIAGQDGDALRVAVLAINSAGTSSEASPPSPEIRFHGAPAAAVASLTPNVAAAPSSAAVQANQSNVQNAGDPQIASNNAFDAAEPNSDLTDSNIADADQEALNAADARLRALLFGPDTRFPLGGLSAAADAWVQAGVDTHFSAGLRLIGTGERNQDNLRELVWQDAAGQIFVSDGARIAGLSDLRDIPSTFEESIRLGATERFLGLADFSGDAIGDWLIEDSTTGDVWILDGTDLASSNARPVDSLEMAIIGHGDFNGDGFEELVWQLPGGEIQISLANRAANPMAPALPMDTLAIAPENQLLIVTDVNGDGRDDLALVNAAGRLDLAIATAPAQAGQIAFTVRAGASAQTDGLELVATFDTNTDTSSDGRFEIAWLDRDVLQVWDTEAGPTAD